MARLVVLEQALRRKSFRKALDTLAEVVEAWHTPAGEKHANTLSVARG
ncbi:MAG: hypothetical protein U5L11_00300 [Arhodomonas sp.]|nr:hypothetical protein [Arhodomonas sp.]